MERGRCDGLSGEQPSARRRVEALQRQMESLSGKLDAVYSRLPSARSSAASAGAAADVHHTKLPAANRLSPPDPVLWPTPVAQCEQQGSPLQPSNPPAPNTAGAAPVSRSPDRPASSPAKRFGLKFSSKS